MASRVALGFWRTPGYDPAVAPARHADDLRFGDASGAWRENSTCAGTRSPRMIMFRCNYRC